MQVIYQVNGLYNTREELLEEGKESTLKRKSKCYDANLIIKGTIERALFDAGAEVTCILELTVNTLQSRIDLGTKDADISSSKGRTCNTHGTWRN